MKTPMVQTQGTTGNTSQESKIGKEGLTMRFASRIAKVNLSQKVLVGLAAGAMLITATAFTYHELGQGQAGSTSYGEGSEVWGGSGLPDTPYYTNPDYRESELGQVSAFLVAFDDATELAYDELSRNFFGIPAAGSVAIAANMEDDVAELYYDEMTRNLLGISAPGSQTAETVQAPAPEFRIDPAWDRAIEQRELIKDYQAMGIRWEYDASGNAVERPLSDRELENLDYARTMALFADTQATASIDQRFPPGTLPED